MKKIILSLTIFCIICVRSQVAIGKTNVTNSSVSLEFADTENRGLILPYVENKTGISQNGTIIYDTSDKKVKYLKNGIWFDLSGDTTGNVNLLIQTTKAEKEEAKVGIGEPGSLDGILVLEDNNKAMILPRVASPHLNIINPAAGMMVYDMTARQLAVYNGTVWSYWKP